VNSPPDAVAAVDYTDVAPLVPGWQQRILLHQLFPYRYTGRCSVVATAARCRAGRVPVAPATVVACGGVSCCAQAGWR
jgi:hypothetical protein